MLPLLTLELSLLGQKVGLGDLRLLERVHDPLLREQRRWLSGWDRLLGMVRAMRSLGRHRVGQRRGLRRKNLVLLLFRLFGPIGHVHVTSLVLVVGGDLLAAEGHANPGTSGVIGLAVGSDDGPQGRRRLLGRRGGRVVGVGRGFLVHRDFLVLFDGGQGRDRRVVHDARFLVAVGLLLLVLNVKHLNGLFRGPLLRGEQGWWRWQRFVGF